MILASGRGPFTYLSAQNDEELLRLPAFANSSQIVWHIKLYILLLIFVIVLTTTYG